MSLSQVLSGLGHPVAYYPKLAKLAGSVNAAIFLSQFLYWRGKGFDGEIFKTQDEIEDETGLVPEEQRTAAKKLVALGLLTITKKGIPARNHYLFDWAELDRQWIDFQRQVVEKVHVQSSRKSTTGEGESPPLDGEKVHVLKKKKETTEETTKETTKTTPVAAAVVKGVVKEISEGWKPSHRCWELIEQAEIPRHFAERLLDEFVLYWQEQGTKRAGWDATFLNWAKVQWDKAQADSAKRAEQTRKTPAAGRQKPGLPKLNGANHAQQLEERQPSAEFLANYGHIFAGKASST